MSPLGRNEKIQSQILLVKMLIFTLKEHNMDTAGMNPPVPPCNFDTISIGLAL